MPQNNTAAVILKILTKPKKVKALLNHLFKWIILVAGIGFEPTTARL